MKRQSSSSVAAAPAERIRPGSGLLLLLECMADCEDQVDHATIFAKLEKVYMDAIETGDELTGRSLSLDPTPEQLAKIRQALAAKEVAA